MRGGELRMLVEAAGQQREVVRCRQVAVHAQRAPALPAAGGVLRHAAPGTFGRRLPAGTAAEQAHRRDPRLDERRFGCGRAVEHQARQCEPSAENGKGRGGNGRFVIPFACWAEHVGGSPFGGWVGLGCGVGRFPLPVRYPARGFREGEGGHAHQRRAIAVHRWGSCTRRRTLGAAAAAARCGASSSRWHRSPCRSSPWSSHRQAVATLGEVLHARCVTAE